MAAEAQAAGGDLASSRLFQKVKPTAHLPKGSAWPESHHKPLPLDREGRPAAGLARCSFRRYLLVYHL